MARKPLISVAMLDLMAGNVLATQGKRREAGDVYRRGLAAANARGDQHAAKELESALAELD